MAESHHPLRALPAVAALLASHRRRHGDGASPALLAHLSRRLIESRRHALLAGLPCGSLEVDDLADELQDRLETWGRPETRPVINATGIVLHSGLGRAVLADEVLDRLALAGGYCLLEVDREDGARRKRDAFCEELLCELTGAEAAIVVNNNAAATMIILNTLGKDREVVVSRSQMIEIGGSYRLPDVMEASGCRLREVGTTNKSYVSDYEKAIGEQTGALMLVHTSNYRIVGFTEHVGIRDLVALGARHGLPVIDDLGSGCLVDLTPHGVHDEPPVQASVRAGADVVCFSGDKLVGGPQAGIIVGKREAIERIRKNHLARALRIDKLACIALETTLKLYLEPERLLERVPTLRMLTAPAAPLERRARALEDALGRHGLDVETVACSSQLGAGSLPMHDIPSFALAVRPRDGRVDAFARALRMRELPVFPRVKDGRVLFDLRTVAPEEDAPLLEAISSTADAIQEES